VKANYRIPKTQIAPAFEITSEITILLSKLQSFFDQDLNEFVAKIKNSHQLRLLLSHYRVLLNPQKILRAIKVNDKTSINNVIKPCLL